MLIERMRLANEKSIIVHLTCFFVAAYSNDSIINTIILDILEYVVQ